MGQSKLLAGVASCFLLAAASPPSRITLTDSETAVPMAAPVLPVRISGDCPGPDACEFGTNWRVCEPVPLYREARDGAPLVRMLKTDEIFVAKRAEIELIAPGEVEMLVTSTPEQTGGLALAKGSKLAVYGPTPGPRAIYFDPVSGKGWSPAAADDSFWWEEKKLARLTRAPAMTWWVDVRASDGATGWLQLKALPDLRNFPMFDHDKAILTWDIDRVRDDETPGCAGLIEIREKFGSKSG